MSQLLHVFQCGRSDLFGLTHDGSGANLPADACADQWRHVKSVEWEGESSPWGLDVRWQETQDAVKVGLALNGFFLSESGALPHELCRN